MTDEPTEIPKMRRVVLPSSGLNTGLGALKTRPASPPSAAPAPSAAPKAKRKAKPKPKPAPEAPRADTDPVQTPVRRRKLSPDEMTAAARRSDIKQTKKRVRKKLGSPHPDVPVTLYVRGIPRHRMTLTGPTETCDAFLDYCSENNFTHWEALELLMRRKGPDPKRD